MSDTKKRLDNLINDGSELASGAIGGALGFFAAGPAGAAALGAGGVLVSKFLKHVGEELSERWLGPRERTRVGATLALTAEEITERIKKGEKIRSDGFFDPKDTGRSDADELAESILLKSQREPEEKKIPLFAHLLANISFSPEIGVSLGEQMIKVVDQLTYRQLCILRLAAIKEQFPLRSVNYESDNTMKRDRYQILHECFDLYNRGMIVFGTSVVFGLTGINPSAMKLEGIGVDIHNWMQLWQIPQEDIDPLVQELGK